MRRLIRLVIQVLRSFPALVLALLATFLFGLGTFAGTFAITLYTFAIMTKLTYEDADARMHRCLPVTPLHGLCLVSGLYPCGPAGNSALVSDQCPVSAVRLTYGRAPSWVMSVLAASA
ncbi:MAG: hypothetical protein ACLUD2_11640 [Clostridium sp.]